MSSEMGDVLKLVELTQTEIDNLSDQSGLYMNSTTNKLNVDGSEVSGGGVTPEPQSIISLSSTDVTTSIIQATASVLSWDVETYKDSGFTHSNTTNNSRIEVDEDGTYEIEANIRMESSAQRAQFVAKILIME